MKSSSINLINNRQVKSPREYRDKIIHEFYLDGILPPYEQKYTDYWLRTIDGSKLKERIKDGEFNSDGRDYSVVWIHRPTVVYKSPKALMSFRWSCLLRRGYVLIKLLDSPMEVRDISNES